MLSIAWSLASYVRALRRTFGQNPEATEMTRPAVFIYFLWVRYKFLKNEIEVKNISALGIESVHQKKFSAHLNFLLE